MREHAEWPMCVGVSEIAYVWNCPREEEEEEEEAGLSVALQTILS